MRFKNYTLDPFQVEAIKSVDAHRSVMVSAPTGSGKTLIADYIIDRELKTERRVIYTAPIKALSNQKYKDFTAAYGHEKIGLITGDVVENPGGQVLIMTTEVYRNMAIIRDPMLNDVSYCIMDEIHYINDEERGYVWEESVIFSPRRIRFLFLSATVPNAGEFAAWVKRIKGHSVDVVKSDFRPVPLEIKFYDSELGITTIDRIAEQKELDRYPRSKNIYSRRQKKPQAPVPEQVIGELGGMLPCIYFVFSRKKTEEYAARLEKKGGFLSQEARARAAEVISRGFRKMAPEIQSLRSSRLLRSCTGKGIGFHHAGMLPDLKHIVEELFSEGLIRVLFATETFAVGINMPAKTVVFDSLRKYTGTGFRYVNSKEFFQISGRAGRRGMDRLGLSLSVIHRPAADIRKIQEITDADTIPITSQFRLSYNTVLNMVNMHSRQEIDRILRMNFYTFQKLGQSGEMVHWVRARYQKAYRVLTKLGYIKSGHLTDIGLFTTKIYSNEIDISQIFMNLNYGLDEHSVLLLLLAVAYEEKREVRFGHSSPRQLSDLKKALRSHPVLRSAHWIRHMGKMTAIAGPIMERKRFVDILRNTGMVEGDLMRLLSQVLDKLEQVDRALMDEDRRTTVRNCKHLIRDCLEGIGFV